MMQRTLTAGLLAVLVGLASSARADVKLNGLFTDGMVLQQGIQLPIWGTATPGETIQVDLDMGDTKVGPATGQADPNGKWRVDLPGQKAGGPFQITIKGNNSLTLKDVYLGEVWLCGGQSNMQWTVDASVPDGEKLKEVKDKSKNPLIRLYTVPRKRMDQPQTDVVGKWEECGPATVGSFTGVGYFFGKDLQKSLGVPVGLINCNLGGTAFEEWTNLKVLEAHPEHLGKHKEQAKLYNGMLAPVIPYAIKGVIWYQGESNAGRADLYRTGFPLMIKNWRDEWNEGDFPFLFVQLAPFMAVTNEPTDTGWAHLRDAQLETMKKVLNTGMAVITDCGDETDIHPTPKEPVGERLSLIARGTVYGQKVEYYGPVFKEMIVEGNKAVLSFSHASSGLEARNLVPTEREAGKRKHKEWRIKEGSPAGLTGFTVCGEDKKFHNAKAEIVGDRVVVTCDAVLKPVAVRYGWANHPLCNLYNKEGLPASPFRTDDYAPTPTPPAPKK